jgi:hypothetical protein
MSRDQRAELFDSSSHAVWELVVNLITWWA